MLSHITRTILRSASKDRLTRGVAIPSSESFQDFVSSGIASRLGAKVTAKC